MSQEKSAVPYVRLGSSGLRVSKIILGCMSYGSSKWFDWVLDEQEAIPLIKQAYDAGITTWDTAGVYSNGKSEQVLAAAIKEHNLPRERIVLATKCFAPVGPDDKPLMGVDTSQVPFYQNHYGLSRAAIFNSVEASLKALNTDYIDLLQIHRCDKDTPKEETMKALHDLITMGKVRYIGASSMWAWEFAQYQHAADKNGWTKFVSMQNQYSLLYREEEREVIPFCKATGVALIPWGPLNGGKLTRALENTSATARAEATKKSPFHTDFSEADKEIINRVEKVAKDKQWTMAQVSFVWAKEKVTCPILGISKADRMKEFIAAVNWTLTAEEIKFLEEPYKPKAISGHS